MQEGDATAFPFLFFGLLAKKRVGALLCKMKRFIGRIPVGIHCCMACIVLNIGILIELRVHVHDDERIVMRAKENGAILHQAIDGPYHYFHVVSGAYKGGERITPFGIIESLACQTKRTG